MNSVISECILDSMDEAMAVFLKSEEHFKNEREISEKTDALQEGLSEANKKELRALLNMMSNNYAIMAEQAYLAGFSQGACFRDETIIK